MPNFSYTKLNIDAMPLSHSKYNIERYVSIHNSCNKLDI